jgi:hypothetical protein
MSAAPEGQANISMIARLGALTTIGKTGLRLSPKTYLLA